jgi:hypothetical protein
MTRKTGFNTTGDVEEVGEPHIAAIRIWKKKPLTLTAYPSTVGSHPAGLEPLTVSY